ncbi:MAG TPA: Fic family protein [Methanocorpusculum sp.]|nr:Fic family protein [Methanocorpusculum sp.]
MSKKYTPPFTITNKIIEEVSVISRQIGVVVSTQQLDKHPHLRKNNRIHSIHSSLAIENNSLTFSQVTDIINGKAVAGPSKDIREVKNAIRAYDELDNLNPFSKDDLLKAHRILMDSLVEKPGELRTVGVGVFSGETCVHLAPPPQFVPAQIDDLLAWCRATDVHPLIQSSVFHFELEFIHPFVDGNGRIGRLWQTLLLIRWEPIFAWIPIESMILEKQQEYYNALNISGKSGNSTVFVEFMLQTIRETLDKLSKEQHAPDLNELEPAILQSIRQNPKITIRELSETLHLSVKQVRSRMDMLKKNGILEHAGSTKSGYWKILTP